ncbi:MAG: permease prefix domain 1-containing protein [Limisphaerales bacterium]
MFNLEQAIVEWRRQMLAAGIKTPVPLEELESHLREEIEWLVKSGLDEQTAFAAAVQKIGSGHMLRNEFGKVEPARATRRQYFFLEIIFMAGLLLIPLVTASQAFCFKDGGFSDMTFGQQTAILAAAVTFSLLAWGMRLGFGSSPYLRTNRVRDAIFVPVLLLVIAGILILPRCDFTEARRAAVSLWVFAPFGILIGWCWGFSATAQKETEPTDFSTRRR